MTSGDVLTTDPVRCIEAALRLRIDELGEG
jgi:hypothetical protein